jgi:hypothetical protein
MIGSGRCSLPRLSPAELAPHSDSRRAAPLFLVLRDCTAASPYKDGGACCAPAITSMIPYVRRTLAHWS